MIKLPQEFEIRMQDMLKEAYPAFLHSYEKENFRSLRVNALKGSTEQFLEYGLFSLKPVAWEKNGFYYSEEDQPGRHPMHEAGLYYIQEPSAMAPAAYIGAEPGEKILDLCAAPGGKTTQIASYLQNKGILVCNEIHPQRAKILSENVERMGITNAVVTNETPKHLAELLEGYFDRILVDAPCSGEGMFRKNEEAVEEWSPENVRLCADRQDEILDCADIMLREGGRLVYSTCTFAPDENEGSIARFIKRHPNYEIEKIPLYDGMSTGVADWCKDVEAPENIESTIRLFPHRLDGEGHYLAVLRKKGEVREGYQGFVKNGLEQGLSAKEQKNLSDFDEFVKATLNDDVLCGIRDRLLKFGDQLYLMPAGMPSVKGMKVLRPGLHLGTLKKNRFEPSHALALALKPDQVKHTMELYTEDNDNMTNAYLNGMTLNHEGEKGWYLMTYRGYSIGWGKLAGQIMKNHYPKGLRK